jgi:hypothetical protein
MTAPPTDALGNVVNAILNFTGGSPEEESRKKEEKREKDRRHS